MLSDRMFSVHLGESQSKLRRLNNGLSQDIILVSVLFDLYTRSLPAIYFP